MRELIIIIIFQLTCPFCFSQSSVDSFVYNNKTWTLKQLNSTADFSIQIRNNVPTLIDNTGNIVNCDSCLLSYTTTYAESGDLKEGNTVSNISENGKKNLFIISLMKKTNKITLNKIVFYDSTKTKHNVNNFILELKPK